MSFVDINEKKKKKEPTEREKALGTISSGLMSLADQASERDEAKKLEDKKRKDQNEILSQSDVIVGAPMKKKKKKGPFSQTLVG